MTAHSRFGGSIMARIIACPGSVKLSEGVPNTSSAAADEGTLLHDVAAQALINWRDSNLTTEEFAAQTNALTEEQRDVVGMFTNFVRTEVDLLDLESETHLLVEERFSNPVHPEFTGTADVVIYNAKSLRVVDLKCGRGVDVQADYNGFVNPQLAFYALGVLHTLGRHDFEDMEVVIVQPRAGGVKRRAVTLDELLEFQRRALDAARMADEPNPPCVAGDHCGKTFCRAIPKCDAYAELAFKGARDDFGDLHNPYELDSTRLGDALRSAELLERWVKAVREHAFLELHAGKTIPGYKLVEKQGNRRWKDDAATIAVLNKTNIGAAMYDQKLKSVAQMEKTLKTMGVDKKLLEDLVERPVGVTLAPESDARPEARSGAAADFSPA